MNCNDGYLLLIYDVNVSDRKATYQYRSFRKAILRRGYEMVQYSFYKKYLRDLKMAEYEKNAIERLSPENSCIHVIKLTVKQAMKFVIPISRAQELVSVQDFATFVEY